MSSHLYTQDSKEKIVLNSKPFASGGEGSLYKIASPQAWTNFVVKIYHPEKLSPLREQKINYLLKHSPQNTVKDSVVWVTDIVKDEKGDFKGFVMPFIKGEKLEILCSTKLPRKLENTWFRFHPDADGALELRLKLCYNLAVAIHQVHASGRYVLVDLKPDNVIVTPEGLVSLVDMDSVEVVENGVKLYDAPVATPEYTPPEKYQESDADPTQQQAWDCFSMAVIFYKLLMQIHPFAGSFLAPYDTATNLSEKIEKGLFVHNNNLKSYRLAIPPLHDAYFKLSKELQQLFETCFVEGHETPATRPTATEWCSTILQTLDLTRSRALISNLVKRPISIRKLTELETLMDSPKTYLDNVPTIKQGVDTASLDLRKAKNKDLTILARKINLLLLLIGIPSGLSAIILENNANLGVFIIGLTFWLSAMLVFFTFSKRGDEKYFFLFAKTAEEELNLYLQQEAILDGIKLHLESFYKKLKEEYYYLFPKKTTTTQENIYQTIELELKNLENDLAILDKIGQQLADSEQFEYNFLKKKYNQLLHTNPHFVNAVSLDAELASIDFAKQTKLEFLHKNLDKDLRKTDAEYRLNYEKEQQKIKKLQKEADSKIGANKAKLELAEKQERKKILLQLKRQLVEQNAVVESNKNSRLTLFKDEIIAFLTKNEISNMAQIKEISRNGTVTLSEGKVVSLAPLRYYQIHELVEWWTSIQTGNVELSKDISDEISKRYARDDENYKKSIQNRLGVLLNDIYNTQKKLRLKWKKVLSQLEKSAQKPILEIEELYNEQISFLQKIMKERALEEAEIHQRFELKFDAILNDAQNKSDQTNLKIQRLSQTNILDDNKVDLYEKNLKKYQQGLWRLTEEQQRLELIKIRLESAQLIKKYYNNLNIKDHLLELLFLKKIQ